MHFSLYALRLHLTARAPLTFADPGNLLRGRFGATLRAIDPAAYQHWFEPHSAPGSKGPSGLADRPRAFAFRAAHLTGRIIPAGELFEIGFHLFDTRDPRLDLIAAVFSKLLDARLDAIDGAAEPLSLPLDPDPAPVPRLRVRFLTPTELKSEGALAPRPAFPILAARTRDRIATLSHIYGAGPLPLDFAGLAARASHIHMIRCEIGHVAATRRSARTGQVHPLGGFIGEAVYEGELTEFAPFLRAAQWTGVGRQTAWGKGQLLVDAG